MKLNEVKQTWIDKYDKPLIISGPCSAESEKQVMETARRLDKSYVQVLRAGIWKPRTKPGSFEGIGAIGLSWLQKAKEEYGMELAIEVATREHVNIALSFDIDYLWLGARTTVNPFLVQEIAEALNGTDKVVLVKNPVNPDLGLWVGAFERLYAQGIKNLGAIHRGFSSYKKSKYRNKPTWQIALDFREELPHIPIITDPSHICGNREGISEVSQTAFNFKFNGLMIESHIDPDNAWSDAKQQITPERVLEILKELELRKPDDEDSLYKAQLANLRQEIDDLDHQVLELLTNRMSIAESIGGLKKEHNVAVFQPERWKETLERSKSAGNSLGLSEEFIEALLKAVHQESVKKQSEIMTKDGVAKA